MGNKYKRVVVKIGSSSLQHATGEPDYGKMEKLVRRLCDMQGRGMEVVLVTSGAIAAGKKALPGAAARQDKPGDDMAFKQAMAAVGQARLMMTYQKLFGEYNHTTAQILMTKDTVADHVSRYNARNTFEKLLELGVIPIVNENDTVATFEIEIGDNDSLSAIVAALISADLLILLSDIDGLYTEDPHKNPQAKLIRRIERLDAQVWDMAGAEAGSSVGTGGMATKLWAAHISTRSGISMVIANGRDVSVLEEILAGEEVGTWFAPAKDPLFDLPDFVRSYHK